MNETTGGMCGNKSNLFIICLTEFLEYILKSYIDIISKKMIFVMIF